MLYKISDENFSTKYITSDSNETSYTKFPMKTYLINKLHQISNENFSAKIIHQITMKAFLPSELHQIFNENSSSK